MEDTTAALRRLPAVGALICAPEVTALIQVHGRTLVAAAVREAIERARQRILAGDPDAVVGPEDVARAASLLARRSLKHAINATGVLLHTNLGRAPLALAAQEAVSEIARGYSNLELDLESGERGSRQQHVAALSAELLGAEAALVVNNCAGATLLMLAALAREREVIVSRGELVEIGGGFRVPEIMGESGARLVEVGTTNKVYLHDYERALSADTAAFLVVHRSNFALVGFTASPTLAELALLAQKAGRWLLVDLGSGLLATEAELGDAGAALARDEPRPRAALAAGADVIVFSGDKLLGGPQAGILAGRRELIERMTKHPLARALRIDKLSLAALEATLRLYRDGRASEVPLVRILSEAPEEPRRRAERLRSLLAARVPDLELTTVEDRAVVGGGSLPLAEIPTTVLLIGRAGAMARHFAATLRASDPPVVARVIEERLGIDLKAVGEEELPTLATVISRVATSLTQNQI